MAGIILILVFLAFVLLSLPVAFSMGLASIAALFSANLPTSQLPFRTVIGMDSFTYLAVPMFILAGSLMETGGIAARLVRLARVLVGHFKGGLAMVVVVSEVFFSGISGSTVADVSAITSMLLPAMKRAGYTIGYSVSVICGASAMGMLVPPCILMVALAGITGESVGALFLAGLLPAIVLALILLVLIWIQAKKYNFPSEPRASLVEVLKAIQGSLIALGMPIVIFGGIIGGVATPTEIAAVAVVYAFVTGFFIYREIKMKDVWRILVESSINTAVIMLLIGFANIFSYILALAKVPQLTVQFFLNLSDTPFVFMLGASLLLIFVGSMLEGIPAALIFTPVFLPVMNKLGISPLHFLIVMVTSIGIGLFIPPAGIGLIIGSRLGDITMETIMKSFYPFLIVLFFGLILLILFPTISIIVPDWLMPK